MTNITPPRDFEDTHQDIQPKKLHQPAQRPSLHSFFKNLHLFPLRLGKQLFKILIYFANKHPSIKLFLLKNLRFFPKLENYLYYLYRHHILKAYYRTPPKRQHTTHSERAEKIYRQLTSGESACRRML
jgi:hypothetical protein